VRIIAGHLKGRRLKAPTWDGLRPTSDKLRETLFNILAPRIVGARVFDGYAGTGAVGLEAISRGAMHVTFVDRDRRAAALIEENLTACRVEGGYTIHCGDAATVLSGLGADSFDLILLDPPYQVVSVEDGSVERALGASARALVPDGLLVLEHATRQEPAPPGSLERVRDVKSGDSTLTFYTRKASPGDSLETR
jgi:16S rRNA (guanine966-N2)-methyltransferase